MTPDELSYGEWFRQRYPEYYFGMSTPFATVLEMAVTFPVSEDADVYKGFGHFAERLYAKMFCEAFKLNGKAWTGRLGSSGMGVISALLFALRLGPNDHIIVGDTLYGETRDLFQRIRESGVDVSVVDPSDVQQINDAYRDGCTRLIFLETVGNGPGMPSVELFQLFHFLWEKQVLLVLDNTLLTKHRCNLWETLKHLELTLQERVFQLAYVESLTKWYRTGLEDQVSAGLMITEDAGLLEQFDLSMRMLGTQLQIQDLMLLPADPLAAASKIMMTELKASAIYRYLQKQERVRQVSYPGKGSVIYLELDTDDPSICADICDALSRNLGGMRIRGSFGHQLTTILPFGAFPEHRAGELRLSIGWDNEAENYQDVITALDRILHPERHTHLG